MPRSVRPFHLSACMALCMGVTITPARATYVCAVQNSAGGFVALRAAPSADAALLARAKRGEALVIQQHANGDQIVSGQWLRVFHYPGDVIPPSNDPEYKKGRIGWVHKRFVGDCG